MATETTTHAHPSHGAYQIPHEPAVRPGILRHRAAGLRAVAAAFLILLGLSASGCSSALGLGGIQEPEVRLMGIEVGDLGLDSAELLLDFEIDNPNERSLRLDGVAYTLNLEGARLLDGRRSERMEIAGRAENRVTLPMTVRYDDLFRALRTLGQEDRPAYELQADFEFDAPLVGTLVVPVNRKGRVSLDRLASRLGGLLGG